MVERKSRNGPFAQIVLDCNNNMITCIMWNESWEEHKEYVMNNKDKIVFISGDIKHDTFRQCNVLQTTSKSNIVVI